MNRASNVVVIGAGISGLAAAAYLGRTGAKVTILEKASAPGGRAATQQKQGYFLNLGAHALYRGGSAAAVLAELGVRPSGRSPRISGHAYYQGKLHTFPSGIVSLLTTGFCGPSSKLELTRMLASLPSLDLTSLDRISVAEWLGREFRTPEAQSFVAAMIRLSTYASNTEELSAGAAIQQMKLATTGGVDYLDGGWQTLVDALEEAAIRAGAELLCDAKVRMIEVEGGQVRSVLLDDGRRIDCETVILAASPAAAKALCPGEPTLERYAETCTRIEAACLDIALRRLPHEERNFALGLDKPLYLSVHSATARLAPEGGAVVHLVHYRPSKDPRADEAALEELMSRVQPGYHEHVVERRFLPRMIVANHLPKACEGGLAGRPAPAVPGVRGLFLAGDWIGREGQLADASLASAKRAAELAAAHTHEQPQRSSTTLQVA